MCTTQYYKLCAKLCQLKPEPIRLNCFSPFVGEAQQCAGYLVHKLYGNLPQVRFLQPAGGCVLITVFICVLFSQTGRQKPASCFARTPGKQPGLRR